MDFFGIDLGSANAPPIHRPLGPQIRTPMILIEGMDWSPPGIGQAWCAVLSVS